MWSVESIAFCYLKLRTQVTGDWADASARAEAEVTHIDIFEQLFHLLPYLRR